MAFKHACILTGGIATGKSTVCSILKQKDFDIIDADVIAKKSLEESKIELKQIFGEEVFSGDAIDRKKLAEIIFSSQQQREKLNSLIHPKVRAEIKRQALEKEKLELPYIIDIPLFFESGDYECRMSIVVYTPKDIQLKRLASREGLSEIEAQKRVDAQMDIEEKKNKADWIIDNSSSQEQLQKETDKFINFIRNEYADIKI